MVADTKTTRKTFKPKTNRVIYTCRKDSPESSCQPPTASPARIISLTQGKYAIVDAKNYEWLNQYKWHVSSSKKRKYFYAQRSMWDGERYITIKMHREILDCKDGDCTDHKNYNTLDNREENLRKCTTAQNQYNKRPNRKSGTSKYKGVYRHRIKWHAEIIHKNKHYHLGFYESEIEAAKAYDAKAKELFGEFAYTNF